MAKLYFRYSAMNAGKSLDLLKTAYNYIERGQNVLLFTSALDNRYGVGVIKSRVGLEMDAIAVSTETNILEEFKNHLEVEKIDCVLCDEVQFFSKEHIDQLSDIVDYYNVPVIAYGLRSDFKNEIFDGSKYLIAISDMIEELKTVCWCGKKATVNSRVVDGKIVKHGEQVQIGGNESYVSVCRKHFKEGKLSK